MKRFPLIAVAIALSMAFCTKEKTDISFRSKAWPWHYYTYIGEDHNYFQQQNPEYYVMTDSPFPACFNTMGHTVCSIKAMGDAWIEGQPDMNTITSRWYRPM